MRLTRHAGWLSRGNLTVSRRRSGDAADGAGAAHGALLGISRELVEAESLPAFERLQRALRHGARTEVRYAVRHPVLGPRWLLTRVEPGALGGGRETTSVVTLDITEQELARRSNEQLLRELGTILDSSPAGIGYLRGALLVRATGVSRHDRARPLLAGGARSATSRPGHRPQPGAYEALQRWPKGSFEAELALSQRDGTRQWLSLRCARRRRTDMASRGVCRTSRGEDQQQSSALHASGRRPSVAAPRSRDRAVAMRLFERRRCRSRDQHAARSVLAVADAARCPADEAWRPGTGRALNGWLRAPPRVSTRPPQSRANGAARRARAHLDCRIAGGGRADPAAPPIAVVASDITAARCEQARLQGAIAQREVLCASPNASRTTASVAASAANPRVTPSRRLLQKPSASAAIASEPGCRSGAGGLWGGRCCGDRQVDAATSARDRSGAAGGEVAALLHAERIDPVALTVNDC